MKSLNDLRKFSGALKASEKMPVVFVGHGSPMNAIEENAYTKGWHSLGYELPKPTAILCISAHWETKGTFVTAMEHPKTIHDFGGFPRELFAVQYAAPGSPELAEETKKLVEKTDILFDHDHWGLDHGCWSVVKNMYTDADIPIIQMSIDHFKSPQWHYDLAKELATLRKKGVLILGSGNMVHNLRLVNWSDMFAKYDWTESINAQFKSLISDRNHAPLINYQSLGKEAQLAIPTPEHYLPMLYILGLQEQKDEISFFNDDSWGPISMTSFKISG
ncbi:4,5-DOPA dioxygenase extradiol [uncultured Imperialibacter sp.]|uniref:4,5-DOPA-extradiol-dioxygenase n=1 Tax=uncultured Imperialibacter sp. TaxID=1672639 RepID=UPI0030D74FAC|tara:strand:- start:489 stop:1313 length:825 start_codon:yes stop_codon:yes gene_type:complete